LDLPRLEVDGRRGEPHELQELADLPFGDLPPVKFLGRIPRHHNLPELHTFTPHCGTCHLSGAGIYIIPRHVMHLAGDPVLCHYDLQTSRSCAGTIVRFLIKSPSSRWYPAGPAPPQHPSVTRRSGIPVMVLQAASGKGTAGGHGVTLSFYPNGTDV